MGAYSVAEVKAQLSAILEAVERGETVVITKRGKSVARISRETRGDSVIEWATIDAFRDSLRKSKASVTALRKRARY
ncbi:MAG: type II toxin-antitoxin system prevent-host-death family antitoxin [Burkholderiales bacterium]